jgi:hypothetical protein
MRRRVLLAAATAPGVEFVLPDGVHPGKIGKSQCTNREQFNTWRN